MMKISIKQRKDDTNTKKLYNQLENVRRHIIGRCTNPNDRSFPYYGAKGASVISTWRTMEGFLADVDNIPGWDLKEFLKGNLQLDKDMKILGNKYYSVDTCLWVSKHANNIYRPEHFVNFVSFNLYTLKINTESNQKVFAKKHGLLEDTVLQIRKGRFIQSKGWTFWDINKETKKLFFIATKKDNTLVIDLLKTRLAKRIGIAASTLNVHLKNNKPIKGYKLSKSYDYLSNYAVPND